MKKAPFIALSATFFDDPRIVEVGEKAGWLLLAMACDSRLHRGDGQVDAHRMSRLGVQGWKPRLDRLLAVGLVTEVEGGYSVPAYLKWNKPEESYQKRSSEGKVAACVRHHKGCTRDDCKEARAWLECHGYPVPGAPLPTG